MKSFRVLASSLLVAASLAASPARADDGAARAQVHVTADGPWLTFVEETSKGRVVVCGRMPCDVALDPSAVYRFVGVPNKGVRDSQPIVLQPGTHVDLDVKTRTEGGLALGWAFFGIGAAVVAAGIVAVVFGYEMDQQTAGSGQALELVGTFAGIVPGTVMGLWGIGGVARNLQSYVTATSSVSPPPPMRAAVVLPLVAAHF